MSTDLLNTECNKLGGILVIVSRGLHTLYANCRFLCSSGSIVQTRVNIFCIAYEYKLRR